MCISTKFARRFETVRSLGLRIHNRFWWVCFRKRVMVFLSIFHKVSAVKESSCVVISRGILVLVETLRLETLSGFLAQNVIHRNWISTLEALRVVRVVFIWPTLLDRSVCIPWAILRHQFSFVVSLLRLKFPISALVFIKDTPRIHLARYLTLVSPNDLLWSNRRWFFQKLLFISFLPRNIQVRKMLLGFLFLRYDVSGLNFARTLVLGVFSYGAF